MQLTLRRAGSLRSATLTKLNELTTELSNTAININVFDTNPVDQLNVAKNAWSVLLARQTALSTAYAELRKKIGNANAVYGINELLTNLEYVKRTVNIFKQPVGELRPTDEQVVARIEGARLIVTNGNGYGSVLAFGFLSASDVGALKDGLAAQRLVIDGINSELDRLNSTSTIDLTDSEVSIFKSESLL